MIKQEAIDTIRTMPDDVTWDDIMYSFYVKQKIDKGLADIDNSAVYSQEAAEKMLKAKK